MAKANLLNTTTVNFLDLLGNGRIYRVPPYQRDYSWTEEQWEDLWTDLFDLRPHPEERHYMGAIVVEGKSDREFSIIDGQQRLATLSLLSLAVIAQLHDLAGRGVEPEKNRERAGGLRTRFIGEKDPASLLESSKLFLNETDDAFYQDYLVQIRDPLNPRDLPASNRLLWDCFRYYRNRLAKSPELKDSGAALATFLAETVARQLMFIQVTVADELNAYVVFETLNARGLELSSTDLLKNYLFSRIKVAADLVALQRRWKALMATVGQEHFPELLRYHLLTEVPKVRKERLFKMVRERVATPVHVFELLEVLEQRAELFSALSDPAHGYWSESTDCRRPVRDLVLFRVSQATPLLFSAWEKLDRQDFARVLKLVSVLSFRYSIVGGLNPNALEPAYHGAAKAVVEGRASSPQEIFALLKSIYVPDANFQLDFARLVVDTAGQRKKLAKYILARLEGDASGREVDPETDPGTIEHILPENPAGTWSASFPKAAWEEAVYRLGNLALLEASANRDVGNAEFSLKLEAYASSRYQITKDIPVQAPREWTPALLDARQSRLAERAVHLWRSDF